MYVAPNVERIKFTAVSAKPPLSAVAASTAASACPNYSGRVQAPCPPAVTEKLLF